MNVHIAIFKWKPGVNEADVNQALRDVEAIANKVPGIVEISCGVNTSRYAEGYSHVILVRGVHQRAIDAYRQHPDHILVAKTIDAMEAHGIGVDFETRLQI